MKSRAKIAVLGLVGRSMFFNVPRFHSGGETVHATGFHEEWGGKGFNQAVAAARQGAHVAFLGKVGSEAPYASSARRRALRTASTTQSSPSNQLRAQPFLRTHLARLE